MKEQIEKINNQANNIETNLKYIKENISKNKEPIFIELIGTAKSGKTTLLNNITKLLTKNGIPVQKRAETNVKLFNECMEAEKEVIKEGAKKYTTIETDPYQGNIKQFIMDLVETITDDVRENIRENIEIREQKTIDDL